MVASSKYSSPEVLARIERLGVRARQAVEGTIAGLHGSPFHGRSVEFVEYRQYAPGDPLSRVDWRVLARTDRFFVKRYEEENNLRATVVLDASRSMRYGDDPWSKFDCAATIAASLSTVLLDQRDAVGLALVDRERREYLPPSAKPSQLRDVIERLEGATPDRETDLGEALAPLSEEIPRRGLVFVISDFLTDLDRLFDALHRMRFRGHELILIQVLHPHELDLPFDGSVNFRDIEGADELMAEPWFFRKEYREAMRAFVADLEARSRASGFDSLSVKTDEPLALVLSHYLHRRQRMHGRRQR